MAGREKDLAEEGVTVAETEESETVADVDAKAHPAGTEAGVFDDRLEVVTLQDLHGEHMAKVVGGFAALGQFDGLGRKERKFAEFPDGIGGSWFDKRIDQKAGGETIVAATGVFILERENVGDCLVQGGGSVSESAPAGEPISEGCE